MPSFPAIVMHHSWNNCFAFIAEKGEQLASLIKSPLGATYIGAAKLGSIEFPSKSSIYVQLFTINHLEFGSLPVIALNRIAYSIFDIQEQVIVEVVSLQVCTSVELEPLSFHDWELIQKFTDKIEETLLSQIKVVQKGAEMPFWVEPTLCVFFRIVRIEPNSSIEAASLSETAEIIIIPHGSDKKSTSTTSISNQEFISSEKKLPFLRRLFSAFSPGSSHLLPTFLNSCSHFDIFRLRILPKFLIHQDGLSSFSHPTALITVSNRSNESFEISICKLEFRDGKNAYSSPALLIFLSEKNIHDSNKVEFDEIFHQIKCRKRHAFLSYELQKSGNFDNLTWIECQPICDENFIEITSLIARIEYGSRKIDLVSTLTAILRKRCVDFPLILNKNGLEISVQFSDESSTKCLLLPSLDSISENSVFVLFPNNLLSIEIFEYNSENSKNIECQINGFENLAESDRNLHIFSYQSKIVTECVKFIEFCIFNDDKSTFNGGHVLICGRENSGKSSIVNKVASRLFYGPNTVFSFRIDCRTLRGKKMENVEKVLLSALDSCRKRRPSVIILDDLDQLCQNRTTHEDVNLDGDIVSERLARVVWRCIDSIRIPTIATCNYLNSLHSSLISVRGRRFFDHVLLIDPLEQADRCDVLKTIIINDKHELDLDFDEAARHCEAFQVGDLFLVVQRAFINVVIDDGEYYILSPFNKQLDYYSNPVQIFGANSRLQLAHLLSAIQSHCPKTKRKLTLTENRNLDVDVGGMNRIKTVLKQVLFWPTMYPTLFKSCPIPPSRGVLLYGPSGCGKTLLAGAVANLCKLGFISVKGPELLSKYIGASEQSVRNTFERARSSKPCLIFFDEFEALAPRRGHDSTGVTDRVVNQLLTELDGIEGLDGVYVLAASSRPDLLDPALLRPGRFDHLLYCGLPNKCSDVLRFGFGIFSPFDICTTNTMPMPMQEDRLQILTILSRRLSFASNVNLNDWASRTERFTGADLKALLTDAQLFAMHRCSQHQINAFLLVDTVDMEQSFVEIEPSISGRKSGNLKSVGQRVTLA